MGRLVAAAVATAAGLELVGCIEARGSQSVGSKVAGIEVTDSIQSVPGAVDVVVEFTNAHVTPVLLEGAVLRGAAFVSGTTGLSQETMRAIHEAAQSIAVLHAPNMSLGVAVLRHLVAQASRLLEGFDVEIVELHHRHKSDAPSGTALALAQTIRAERPSSSLRTGRSGTTGPKPEEEIGVHSVRAGGIAGEHHVIFAASGERVVLTHKAESRDAFVWGAIRAVRFLAGKRPGLYAIEDVLGLAGS